MARSIVQRELDQLLGSPYQGLDFHFLGGEPLLNFNLIHDLCEWVWAAYGRTDVAFHFYVITNGTLLDGAKRSWFEEHKHLITVDMSVDGLDASHQINRGCLTRDLPVTWVHACWPQARFKMTVSRQTLPFMAEGVIALFGRGYDVSVTPAMGEAWTDADAIQYAIQWQAIANHYGRRPVDEVWRQLLKSIEPLFEDDPVQEKCCGAGDCAVTYDVDGELYPCVVFTPLVFGRDTRSELASVRFEDRSVFEDPACSDCFIRNMCKTCYGFNLRERGKLSVRDKSLCRMYKTEIRAICEFQWNLLRMQETQRQLTSREMVRMYKAQTAALALKCE